MSHTAEPCSALLDYAATYPDTTIWHRASGMRMYVESDASYLSIKNACSCVGGHFTLSDNGPPDIFPSNPTLNGVLHAKCKRLQNVMMLTAEEAPGVLFHNG